MARPRISLVTPSFQQAEYLEECITSVHRDAPEGLEHIVVDGGSTDGSRDVIEAHADRLAWWVSEKDKGQSDALNKGLAHAHGEVFNWLNSDDALTPGALQCVSDAFADDPELLVYGGRVVLRGPDGDAVHERLNDAGNAIQLFCEPVINQPATFYRMDVVRAIGGVDPALRYVMDVELWWQFLFRFGTDHLRFEAVDLAIFRLHADSKTVSAHTGFLDETATLLHGMCTAVGAVELAQVLALGHGLSSGLRGIPVKPTDARMVKAMTVHFLLKWHGHVHRREQYHMMKALVRSTELNDVPVLNATMEERLRNVHSIVESSSWWTYRLSRKLKYLRG